jgi:VanZ family protein
MLWTLLILLGCFTPQKDIPEVNVPLIDKWTHIVLFGGFSFLWLCARPVRTAGWLFSMFFIAVAFGGLIELMQGLLPALGRSMEGLDLIADSLGGAAGIVIFTLMGRKSRQ